MRERKFITESVKKLLVSEYIRKETESAGFGSMVMKRTPFGTNITLHVNKPGLVIGRRGSKIQEITENLEKLYSVESPQIEVKEAENPDLNPQVVSKKIALSLEKGWSYRKAGNTSLRRAVDSDVKGIMIKVSGKLTGERSRTQKFFHGSVKYSGEPGRAAMLNGFSIAKMKQGVIGITVRILDPDYRLPDEITYALDGTRKVVGKPAEKGEAKTVTEVEPAVETGNEPAPEEVKPEAEKVKNAKPAKKPEQEKTPETAEEPAAAKETQEKKAVKKDKTPGKSATRKAAEKKEEKEGAEPKKTAAKKTTVKKAAEKKADEEKEEKEEKEKAKKPETKSASSTAVKAKETMKETKKKAAPRTRAKKQRKETEDTVTEASKNSEEKQEETDGADSKKD